MVEALAELKRRQGEIDMLRATRPARFGWTVGPSFTCGYDFSTSGITCVPGIGISFGLRF